MDKHSRRYIIAEKKYLAEMARLHARAFNAPPWYDDWTEETATKYLTYMMDSVGFFGILCFEEENHLCGMILGNEEVYFEEMRFHMKDLCVDPNRRNREIATDLLDELENHLLARDMDEYFLFTSSEFHIDAFYRRKGFQTYSAVVMMGKSLRGRSE